MHRLKTLMLLLGLGFTADGVAASLRCDNRLVTEGMSQYEVQLHCGDPQYAETVKEAVEVQFINQTEFATTSGAESGQINSVTTAPHYREIERWTYHRPGGKLIRQVDFYEGKVLRITTTGRAP